MPIWFPNRTSGTKSVLTVYQWSNGADEGCRLNEHDLIDRALRGDLDAFAALIQAHQSTALRVAYLVVKDHQEAEDIVQDAFMKAHAGLDRFRSDSPFRPWLLRIVQNESLNRVRRAGRQRQLAIRAASQAETEPGVPSPESMVLLAVRRRELLDALDRLPGRYRSVISHRYLLGLSETETADVLGLPAGTVKSRTSRGLSRLRSELETDVREFGDG